MSSSPVEAPAHLGEPSVVEVSDGVYAYIQPDGSWWINNTGFLAGSQGVISIDACSTEARTKAYLSAITSVSKRPVRTLINTHHHADHTFGNCLFEGATIVAHEKTRAEMTAFGPPQPLPFWTPIDWGDLRLELPFLTYAEGVTVWSDELRCEVRYVGTAAHTTNDSIIWLPERSVLFAGDLLFRGGTPFLLMGSVAGAIDVLETVVRPLGAETIVPGHGGISGPELIDDVLGYLRFVQDTARAGKAAGLTPLQAAREVDLGGYAALLDSERIVGNLHRAYADLGAVDTVDLRAALADMVTFNGGKPLSCYA
jgi:cyclase